VSAAAPEPRPSYSIPLPHGGPLVLGQRTLLMGIVNVTPDSFSDGGRHATPEAALAHAQALVEAGAGILDVGGESTRPGAPEQTPEVQLGRVLPVLRGARERWPGVPLSIDTRSAEVARAAVAAGAAIVNDISGLTHDADMRSAVADLGVPAVVMHMRGTPADMRARTEYDDVVGDVLLEQQLLLDQAREAGVAHVIADPGLGFAKTAEQSLALLRATPRFVALGVPLLVGPSRKSFLRPFTEEEEERDGAPPDVARRDATIAAAALAAYLGAHIVRVHDVASCRAAIALADALREPA